MGTPGLRQLHPALGQSQRPALGVCWLPWVAKVGMQGGWFRACPKKNMGWAFIARLTPPWLSKSCMSESETGVTAEATVARPALARRDLIQEGMLANKAILRNARVTRKSNRGKIACKGSATRSIYKWKSSPSWSDPILPIGRTSKRIHATGSHVDIHCPGQGCHIFFSDGD